MILPITISFSTDPRREETRASTLQFGLVDDPKYEKSEGPHLEARRRRWLGFVAQPWTLLITAQH